MSVPNHFFSSLKGERDSVISVNISLLVFSFDSKSSTLTQRKASIPSQAISLSMIFIRRCLDCYSLLLRILLPVSLCIYIALLGLFVQDFSVIFYFKLGRCIRFSILFEIKPWNDISLKEKGIMYS